MHTTSSTEAYYYGLRTFQPEAGRWMSRDPTEERGCVNLFLFTRNDPLRFVDPQGLTYVSSQDPFPGAYLYFDDTYRLEIDDGQFGTVELNRITMAEIEAEKKELVNQLQRYGKLDGCKSRKYEGGFDSKYFAGEKQQHQYYLVDGKAPLYADNEINYIGIGLYEAWLCDSRSEAKAIVWGWKLGKWHTKPTAGTMHWLEIGYNNYKTLKSADDTCCRCGGDSSPDDGGRRR